MTKKYLVLLMLGCSVSVFASNANIKIWWTADRYLTLQELPDAPIADKKDAYELLQDTADSLRVVGQRTYSAVSTARINMAPTHLAMCTNYLKKEFPDKLAQGVVEHEDGASFIEFLQHKAQSLDFFGDEVKNLCDLLEDAGVVGHPVQQKLMEFKEALMFAARHIMQFLPRQWPELQYFMADDFGPGQTCPQPSTPSGRQRWQLVADLYNAVNNMCDKMFNQMEAIGEELMLSLHQVQRSCLKIRDVSCSTDGRYVRARPQSILKKQDVHGGGWRVSVKCVSIDLTKNRHHLIAGLG